MRAWIETLSGCELKYTVKVALRVRAWIETFRVVRERDSPMSPSA